MTQPALEYFAGPWQLHAQGRWIRRIKDTHGLWFADDIRYLNCTDGKLHPFLLGPQLSKEDD